MGMLAQLERNVWYLGLGTVHDVEGRLRIILSPKKLKQDQNKTL
jgi:hypothetical protein